MLFALRNHGDIQLSIVNLRLKSIVGIDETSSLALYPATKVFKKLS
jgi:hypothetical protein